MHEREQTYACVFDHFIGMILNRFVPMNHTGTCSIIFTNLYTLFCNVTR